MKKKSAAVLSICALGLTAAAPAFAGPNEGPGNGGGQSKQCTGPQADRPASCNSQGGPGDQGSN